LLVLRQWFSNALISRTPPVCYAWFKPQTPLNLECRNCNIWFYLYLLLSYRSVKVRLVPNYQQFSWGHPGMPSRTPGVSKAPIWEPLVCGMQDHREMTASSHSLLIQNKESLRGRFWRTWPSATKQANNYYFLLTRFQYLLRLFWVTKPTSSQSPTLKRSLHLSLTWRSVTLQCKSTLFEVLYISWLLICVQKKITFVPCFPCTMVPSVRVCVCVCAFSGLKLFLLYVLNV